MVQEVFFQKNKLRIDDSTIWPEVRETEFGNFKFNKQFFTEFDNFDFLPDKVFFERDLKRSIQAHIIVMTNESETHERIRTKFITSVADLGGLYALLTAIFSIIYWSIAEPSRDLHLAVSFNNMKNKICRQEGLISESASFDK